MTFNISLAYEQQQRVETDLAAVEVQIEEETDLYHRAQFLAVIGTKEPEQQYWSNLSYRAGWLDGVGEYYDKKFQRDLPLVGKPDQASSLNF